MRIQKRKFVAEISEPKRGDEFTTTEIIHFEENLDRLCNLTLYDLKDLKELIDRVINYLYEVE